jgi:hypothetical protein
MRNQKTLSFVIAVCFLTTAAAQSFPPRPPEQPITQPQGGVGGIGGMGGNVGMGGPFGDNGGSPQPSGAPQPSAWSPQGGQGRLPEASDLSSLQCSFKTILEQDDARVLGGVLSAIQALEGTDSCRPPQGQDRASALLQTAISNYQNANGGNVPGGFVGNISTTCWNYERLFNQEYDYFLATFDPEKNSTNAENYRSCASANDRDAAVVCAAGELSEQKSRWEYSCAQASQATSTAETISTQIEAMQLAMRTLEEMISNPGCVDATGAGRAGLIQNGFQLAARAAMIGMDPSSPFTVLASGAAGLISKLLGDLFTSEAQSEQLVNRSQFNDLACMYEDIEARAFRCNRNGIEAQLNANMDVERRICADLNGSSLTSYLNGLDSFLPQLSSVTRELSSMPAENANPLTSDQVHAIAGELGQAVPNGDGQTVPVSSLLGEAADRVLAGTKPNMTRPEIEAYIREHGLTTTPEGYRELRDELTAAHTAATSLKGFVDQIQQKGTVLQTEFDLTPEQLNEVRSAMPAGGLSAIQTVLSVAQRQSPDESDKIALFNARLEQGKTLGAVVTAQNDRRAILANIPQDNGIMEGHRKGLQVMMAKRFEDELERLVDQAKVDQRNFDHANTTQVRKQEIVTQSLYPIVRMCNQLRTQAIEMESYPQPDRLPRACNNFICSDNSMLGTFRYEMEVAGNLARTGMDDRGRCSTVDCNGFYSQFICKERNKIETIRSNLYGEFDRSGTICGRQFGSIRFD